jgi:hypothetical protein
MFLTLSSEALPWPQNLEDNDSTVSSLVIEKWPASLPSVPTKLSCMAGDSPVHIVFGRYQRGDFIIVLSFLHSLVLAIIKWFLLVSWFYLFICLSLILLLFLEGVCSPANAFILGDAWHKALAIAIAKCKLSELCDHKGFNYWNLFTGLDKKSALMKDGPDSTMSRDLGYR